MNCLFYRLLAHAAASAYFEIGSFPDSEMKRALRKLERRQLVSGEDGGRRKVKKKKVSTYVSRAKSEYFSWSFSLQNLLNDFRVS